MEDYVLVLKIFAYKPCAYSFHTSLARVSHVASVTIKWEEHATLAISRWRIGNVSWIMITTFGYNIKTEIYFRHIYFFCKLNIFR